MLKTVVRTCFLFVLLALTACNRSSLSNNVMNETSRQFGIFKVLNDDTTVEMNGTIGRNSLANFKHLLAVFPKVNKINIVNCDGSTDDEVNLQVSKLVHDKNINTHLNHNATIASGGVDFFLAGAKRTRGENTRMGVHSWGGDDNEQAFDFPRGHVNHQPYINYYKSVGFTQQEAEDFYYFTIYAAPASEIHFMTEAQIVQYKMLKG